MRDPNKEAEMLGQSLLLAEAFLDDFLINRWQNIDKLRTESFSKYLDAVLKAANMVTTLYKPTANVNVGVGVNVGESLVSFGEKVRALEKKKALNVIELKDL